MDPKYKDINALDFVKQTLSRIDIEDLHKDQRDFYDFIKEMIDRVSEVKIPPEETPRPRP